VERLYEKPSNTGEPPRHEADHGSVHERLPARTQLLVVFAHPPVLCSIQAIVRVRSTTQLLGNTTNPLGGNSFCQSTATPSLAHSLAHAIITSSGAGLRGRSTTSTLHPKVFATQSLRPCPLHASPHPPTGGTVEEIARRLAAVAS
jgi:hypothetical protein